MDRTAELIKIDNMLHELEIKLAQNKSSQDLMRVLQIRDPSLLKAELSKFDPNVLNNLLTELNKVDMSPALTDKQKTVVSQLEKIFEMSHIPDLIGKILPKIQGLQNLGILADFLPRAGFALNAAQKMNTPTPAQLQKKMKGDPIYGGNADVTLDGAVYFPSQELNIGGSSSAQSDVCTKIIANYVVVHGTPYIGNDCSDSASKPIGNPIIKLTI
jgi:hypothetical protein